MTAAYFEDHPTDPDKVILRKKARVEDDDDIQVYQRPWVWLTDEEIEQLAATHLFQNVPSHLTFAAIFAIQAKLKEKNT